MRLHDAWARITPYELAVPDLAWARDRFAAVREEAAARGVHAGDPAGFVLLGEVGRLLQELRGGEEAPEWVRLHGLLLFHAFHFWSAGERLFLARAPWVQGLLAAAEPPGWSGLLTAPAGYLQLPQHLFWLEGDGGAPESVDGFFWTAPEGAGELHLLLAAGLRADRPGFSVVPLPPAPLADAGQWSAGGGAEPFRSALPGAELGGLRGVSTPAEVLALAARIFSGLSAAARPGTPPPADAAAPRPSQLTYAVAGG